MNKANFEVLVSPPETLESHASIFGDNVMWLKFIFTDDIANANGQGIRQDEFRNIIQTGKLKPFKKMTGGMTGEGHDDAVPIGTIASLEQVDNKIEAIAAVWEREFPDDAEQIRAAYAAKEPLNISWELWYEDEVLDEFGVAWLQNITTRAATMVNRPAYEGRTPILTVAAEWSNAYVNHLPDAAFLYVEPGGEKDERGATSPRTLRHLPYKSKEGKIDEAHLESAVASLSQIQENEDWLSDSLRTKLLEKVNKVLTGKPDESTTKEGDSSMELEQLKAQLDAKEEALSEAKTELADSKANLEELQGQLKELEELRQFKEQVETERTRNTQLDERFNQISDAGIEMERDAFDGESERWLGMDDEAFGFVLKMLVDKPSGSEASASAPPIQKGKKSNDTSDPLEIVKEFLETRRNSDEES